MSEEKAEKRNPAKLIGNIVGYAVIAAVIIFLLFVIIARVTGHTVFVFGKTTAWVMTGSMEPEIPEQSFILVRKADKTEINVGDVIVFESDDPNLNSAYNTHRVVEIIGDRESFVTKGDAYSVNDEYPADGDKILGVYERNLPVLTAFGRFMFSGVGKIIAITFVFVVLLLMYIPRMRRSIKQKDEEIKKKHEAQIDELVRAEVKRLRSLGPDALNAGGTEEAVQAEAPPEEGPEETPEQGGEEQKPEAPAEETTEQNET